MRISVSSAAFIEHVNGLCQMLLVSGVPQADVEAAKAQALADNSENPLKALFFNKSPIGQFFSKK